MKIKALIEKLQQFDPEKEACLFDHKENLRFDSGDGEGSSLGIYPEFNVFEMDKKDLPKGRKTWIALEFDNNTREEDED